MRTRMYGGVGGRKTKVGRKLTFVFLLPDCNIPNWFTPTRLLRSASARGRSIRGLQ